MRNFNLPNLLTIIRILALPFCAYALFKNGGDDSTWRIIAWTLFFIVGMTDTLDGKLARSRNQVTPLGTFLDPIADKAVIGTALIGLSILGDMPWWITIFILSRELLVTLLRLVVIKRGVIPASRGGKAKTLTQGFAIGFYIFPMPHWFDPFNALLMGVAVILTLVTGFQYLKEIARLRASSIA